MKVIDLLNKIANGEEVPKKIKLYNNILVLNENKNNYLYEENDKYWGDELIHWFELNDEVEIIEEDKKIEKIPYHFSLNYVKSNLTNEEKEGIDNAINGIYDKINEIIDYINKE